MSRRGLAAPILGATAVLGGGVYYFRSKPTNTAGDPAQQVHDTDKPRPTADEVALKKERANAKRDLGMGGAGVGMNHATGGTDIGSGLKSGNTTQNPNRDTAKGPTEKFPSDAGAVGGGHGRGNANTRAIETHGPSSPSNSSGTNTDGGISHRLQGFFGTGGHKEGERPPTPMMDTKVASHHGDTPTNRGGSPWDKHRRDVTATAEKGSPQKS